MTGCGQGWLGWLPTRRRFFPGQDPGKGELLCLRVGKAPQKLGGPVHSTTHPLCLCIQGSLTGKQIQPHAIAVTPARTLATAGGAGVTMFLPDNVGGSESARA